MTFDLDLGLAIYATTFTLGIVAGFLSGLLGIGGGWLITPGLNLLGIPMPQAVATSLAQMIGGSLSGSFQHYHHKNIKPILAIKLGIPLVLGVWAGKKLMIYWRELGMANEIPQTIFIVVLTIMGTSMVVSSFRRSNNLSTEPEKMGNLLPLHLIFIPPIGVLSGILGMGGGFFMVPLLIYLAHQSPQVAAGTSLIVVLAGSFVGTIGYALEGLVVWPIAITTLLGSLLGGFIGAKSSAYIQANTLKKMFSALVLIAALAMLLKRLDYPNMGMWVLSSAALSLVAFGCSSIIRGLRQRH